MRFPAAPFAILTLSALLNGCCDGLPVGQTPGQAPVIPQLGLFALKASNGQYVTYATPDSSGRVILQATKTSVGPNEVFTAKYSDSDHFGIAAANGKIVCVDRNQGSVLIADRDYVGEWETFTLEDVGNGHVAFKNSNGQYVGAHHDLPAPHSSQLIADKLAAYEWEQFVIEVGLCAGRALRGVQLGSIGVYIRGRYRPTTGSALLVGVRCTPRRKGRSL
jgi:hypothetical protein